MANHLRTELVLNALEVALPRRQKLIRSANTLPMLSASAAEKAGVRPSMDSVGNSYHNALCESFFATFECELLDRRPFRFQTGARMAILDFVQGCSVPAPFFFAGEGRCRSASFGTFRSFRFFFLTERDSKRLPKVRRSMEVVGC